MLSTGIKCEKAPSQNIVCMNMAASMQKLRNPTGDDDGDTTILTVMHLQSLLVVAGGAAVSGLSPGYGQQQVSCDWSTQGHVAR